MNNWFIGKRFIAEEQRKLRTLADRNEANSRSIRRQQSQLLSTVAGELVGFKGLSLGFGAGCATALAFKNREHLSLLKHLPWAGISQLAQQTLLEQTAVEPEQREAQAQPATRP